MTLSQQFVCEKHKKVFKLTFLKQYLFVLSQQPRFRDDKVQEGKEYEYRVYAINEAGSSEPSATSVPIIAKPVKGII